MSESQWNHDPSPVRPLVDRLRMTLAAARCNVEIRERLMRMLADPDSFDPIVRELGARHALVRELKALASHGKGNAA